MRCIICGKDLSDQPAMRDNVTGILYCSEHSRYMDVVNAGELAKCPKCGSRYSQAHSLFAKGTCPSCGVPLSANDQALHAKVLVPYGRSGENDQVRQHVEPLLNEVAERLRGVALVAGDWSTERGYTRGVGYSEFAALTVDPAGEASLDRNQFVAAIQAAFDGLQFPAGSHIYCRGEVPLWKRGRLP